MEQLQLGATPRETAGKVSSIRRSGMIPAVVYGKDFAPISVKVVSREFEKALMKGARHHIVNLTVSGAEGENSYPVMVKAMQMDAVKGEVIHIDFHKISLLDKITATVPVVVVGSDDVEKRGGIVQHQMRQVEVECLPTDIPDRLTLDITGFNVGDHIAIKDLKLPAAVEAVDDDESIVITIVAPRHAEEEEVKPEGAVTAEPEVIGKKPEEKEKA
jgi:large subunit ribosomal protein L25